MTIEPRPGVPGLEELRERLIAMLHTRYGSFMRREAAELYYGQSVDAILAEIAAAGLSIVATPTAGAYVAVDRDVWMEILTLLPGDVLSWVAANVTPLLALDSLAGGDR